MTLIQLNCFTESSISISFYDGQHYITFGLNPEELKKIPLQKVPDLLQAKIEIMRLTLEDMEAHHWFEGGKK